MTDPLRMLPFTLTAALLAGCNGGTPSSTPNAPQAIAAAPALITYYGCGTCHHIDSVPGAVGKVGPPLQGLAQRSVLAGSIPNSTENLISWIEHPQHFKPGVDMPEMNVTPADARTIALFLQSRR